MPHRVAFLGFSESERHALGSYFRLAHNRSPSYEHVATLTDADYLVADADHAPSVQLVVITERLGETVFIGAQPPEGNAARLKRPIDALHVMRELDAIVASRHPSRPPRDDGGQHTTIIQAMHRQRATETAVASPAPAVLLGDLPFSTPDPLGTAVAPPPAAAAWPREAAPPPDAAPAAASTPAAEPDDAPDAGECALTLRDPPTPAPGDNPPAAAPALFPGADGLVGHEPPLPSPPGGWTEDLTALHAIPLPTAPLAPAAPAAPAPPPATPALPAAAALPVLHDVAPAPAPAPAPAAAPAVRRPRPLAPRPPLVLPRAPVRPTAAAAEPAPPPKPVKPPKVPKASLLPGAPRALLVDDSVIALLFLEKRLERWHVQPEQAATSQAALALLALHSYDIVFLDVELGPDSELDGLALCRQIKQTPASMNALVVMVSVHHGELDRVRGSLAGCDAYLGKPLDDAELRRLMERQGLGLRTEAGTVTS